MAYLYTELEAQSTIFKVIHLHLCDYFCIVSLLEIPSVRSGQIRLYFFAQSVYISKETSPFILRLLVFFRSLADLKSSLSDRAPRAFYFRASLEFASVPLFLKFQDLSKIF